MSDEDLLVKIDEIVAKRFNEIIEGERAKMKAEVEASNAEKQKANDIIHPSKSTISYTSTLVVTN
jgi:hypothetical protein